MTYRSAQEIKNLFFRVHSANKNSQTRTFAEKTARFRVRSSRPFFLGEIPRRNSAKTRGVSPRTFAEFLREISRRYSSKTPSDLKKLNSLFFFCFAWFLVLCPSQQLWSCRDGSCQKQCFIESYLLDVKTY